MGRDPIVCTPAQLLSHVQLSVTPWTAARQAPLSVGILQARTLECPPPRDSPDPGIEPTSPALPGRFVTTEPPGEPPGPY